MNYNNREVFTANAVRQTEAQSSIICHHIRKNKTGDTSSREFVDFCQGYQWLKLYQSGTVTQLFILSLNIMSFSYIQQALLWLV